MNSFLIFLIFVMLFVFAQCNFTEVAKVECTPKHSEEYRGTVKNATCSLHYRHVVLEPMLGQMFRPSLVSVLRCDGHSEADTVCAPTRTQTRQVPVSILTLGSDGQYTKRSNECTVVNVEEHVSCGQICKQQATDCNAKQEYIKYRCKCVCKEEEERRKKCSKLQKWDDKGCKCICLTKTQSCSTGYEWNPDHCTCMQK